MRCFLVIILVISLQAKGLCQKMIFTQYEVGDGLVQSQVNQISQDSSGTLWITSHGGISRFNGSTFSNLTKQDGLLSNQSFAAVSDKKKNIWISTAGGISVLQDKHLKNLNVPRFKSEWVGRMVCDRQNRIWGIAKGSLYIITDTLITKVITINGKKPYVQAIQKDHTGKLWASLRNDGIYSFNEKWIKEIDFSFLKPDEPVRSFFVDRSGEVWIVTKTALYHSEKSSAEVVHSEYFKRKNVDLYLVFLDYQNNVWIGSSNGAFRVTKRSVEHFTAKNGLTDAPIFSVFEDLEKNVWLGTNGHGVFKFSNNDLKILDTDFGLADNVVSSLETDGAGKIWIGTGGVIYELKAGKLYQLKLPWISSQVYLLYRDSSGKIWAATSAGFGYFSGSTFKVVENSTQVLSIAESEKHGMLIGTRTKLFTYQNGLFGEIPKFAAMPISLFSLDDGDVLIGTNTGIELLSGKNITKPFEALPFAHSPIISLVKYKNLMLVGTGDQGIFLWDINTGRISNCTVVDGLLSDVVYSLKVDNNGLVWAGTGRGVNKIEIDAFKLKFEVFPASESTAPAVECNTMALIQNGDEMWFGTTKGIYIYDIKVAKTPVFAPKLQITNTQLIKYVNGNAILKNTSQNRKHRFRPDENNFSISYKAIYLTDPENVAYQYQLAGLETAYSPLSKNTNVTYTALSPGDYEFRVVAISPRGVKSNTATFAFYISPPYYDTFVFRLFIILLAGLTVLTAREYLSRRKRNRKLLLEQIKEEEQQKVRQQTSEDFHDDIGNKLARITALSELLERMTPEKDQKLRNVIFKIKDNAAELYEGTRHIIWSISPESDNFYEIILFIKSYGIDLFDDHAITFHISGLSNELKEIKLPYQYSRQLTMIFKEGLNNAFKHSGASEVKLEISVIEEDTFNIVLSDNGTGINEGAKKYSNGLRNMKRRAERIRGHLNITSLPGRGTTITVKFSVNDK